MTKEEKLKSLNDWCKNTLLETLEIKITDVGDDFVVGTMPVNSRVHQPLGMLHGGASAALAESLASMLSNVVIDRDKEMAVGTNLNNQHLKVKREGLVTGTARLIKKGRTQHFTEICICDEAGDLICYSTMTNTVLHKRDS